MTKLLSNEGIYVKTIFSLTGNISRPNKTEN